MSQIIPINIPTYISDQNYNPSRVLPRLLFYNGLVECEEYYLQSGSLTAAGIAKAETQFPYFDNYNVISGQFPTTDSDSLLFNNEPAAYGEVPTETLYTTYWEKYINLLYNPQTRLFNCSGIIPLADYFKMQLNNIVQWRGNFYHLRALNNYDLKTGKCDIQLLGPIISEIGVDCSFDFSVSVTGSTTTTTLAPTTTTTTAAPTTTTTTLVPTTTTTTLVPTTTTTTLVPTTTTTTLVPTTTTTTAGTTTTTTLVPTTTTTTAGTTTTTTAGTTTTTTLGPTTTTTTVIQNVFFKFDISSSLSVPFIASHQLYINLSGSAIGIGTDQTLSANSNISYSGSANIPSTVPFYLNTTIVSSSLGIKEAIYPDFFDIRITDVYDNGLPALSASYLGNGGAVKGESSWGYNGFWSSSLWNSVTRSVEIGLSVNRNLTLYNMSGSNGFATYALAKPYLNSSGSIYTTIGILPVSQSIMQKGWGVVAAYHTDYTTRYQANVSARRFYIAEFNNNREIIRFEPDTYNTISNISVQRLDKITPSEIQYKGINNIGGAIIPTDACNGTGTSTSNMYYNQESSSFYVRSQAAAFFNYTYANFNYYGTEVWLNSNLTTAFNGYGAFKEVTNLENMQGNYTPSSDGIPFVVYQAGCFVFCPRQNVLETTYDCP